MYARFYKNYFKKVYTFEPDDLCFYCLDRNCVGEGYYKYHGALGNTTEKLSLSRSPFSNNQGMHQISDNPGNVQIYKIDDLNLTECDSIHLDIEGYEAHALRGALNTINQFKPVIILERGSGNEVIRPLGYKPVKALRMDIIYTI